MAQMSMIDDRRGLAIGARIFPLFGSGSALPFFRKSPQCFRIQPYRHSVMEDTKGAESVEAYINTSVSVL